PRARPRALRPRAGGARRRRGRPGARRRIRRPYGRRAGQRRPRDDPARFAQAILAPRFGERYGCVCARRITTMRVRFWGVRGSIPVPGRTTSRYGGNTSCVEVRPRRAAPIIIDAGTGLRRLGKALMEDSFGDGRGEASILISHTHWDHVQGLPFFSPLYRAGNQVDIFARRRDTHLEAVFSQQHGAPYFSVPMSAMQADIAFHELTEGAQFEI